MQEKKINQIGCKVGQWPLDPNKPTLIFVHGSGGTNVLWQNQVETLSEICNTVAPDLPGHGLSDGPGLNKIPDYAKAMENFIAELNPPNPIPVGLSIGGGIVIQMMLNGQERYKAGILVNTGARLRVSPDIIKTVETDYAGYLSSFKSFAISPKTDPGLCQPLMEASANCPPEIALGDFQACDCFDVMDQLENLSIPILILTADEDLLTPAKYGRFIADKIKSSKTSMITKSGHLSPMEQPAQVNAAISNFLIELKLVSG